MMPQLETCTQISCPVIDTSDSEFVLSEFLYEMEALDHMHSPSLEFTNDFTRRRESDVQMEPESKKRKLSDPLTSPTMWEVSTKPVIRKGRIPSWLQELSALRSELETLKTQVALLHVQHQARNALKPTTETPTEEQELWKSVAAIARQRCQNAQNENARLKHELKINTCVKNAVDTSGPCEFASTGTG
ncbi:hypothetical protein PHYPSEUDO_011651 [Phytophthora pseudosyringae]|uniref:Uncharacterized protein n=1 Tax=Phytophthora pseudosyringae TaxID=221518 RepID=A0A8T1V8X7_9STRA|nr:hypothetical protein PHYPSEUDO_011651 [Phytophthora pseudosyringae]